MSAMDDRELDTRIALEVMGWTLPRTHQLTMTDNQFKTTPLGEPEILPLPHFSTDIKAAWLVVEKTNILQDYLLDQAEDGQWRISKPEKEYGTENMWLGGVSVEITAPTAPMAICLAALSAREDQR